jgi:thiamine biosynthesis protein ThiC
MVIAEGPFSLAGCTKQTRNPFYHHFDEILDIAREYDVTLSLMRYRGQGQFTTPPIRPA